MYDFWFAVSSNINYINYINKKAVVLSLHIMYKYVYGYSFRRGCGGQDLYVIVVKAFDFAALHWLYHTFDEGNFVCCQVVFKYNYLHLSLKQSLLFHHFLAFAATTS